MKENRYDDEIFFGKYSKFPRSVEGLAAAGEWHEMKRLLPDFRDRHVLDIGCGFGWHCIYAAEQGAAGVLGIDISEKMLAVAREKTSHENVEYRCVSMEDMDFESNAFDVVISSLAFHYTPDFSDICHRVKHCLSGEGDFVFSVEHPVFTAGVGQDWSYDSGGEPEFWPVDNYFEEGRRDTVFLGEHVIKYHKTLTTYINTLLKRGFRINEVVEPKPAQDLLDTVPGMRDELRRPMMLIVSAKKEP